MNSLKNLRITVSLFCLGVAAIHLLTPLKIDHITLGLMVLAVLPWLTPLVKSLELPGLGKIELQDIKEKAEAALKTSEENRKRIDANEQQSQIDARALAVLEKLTSDNLDQDGGQPPEREIKDALKAASPMVRVLAFARARQLRKEMGRSAEARERLMPVFEALTEVDSDKKFHRNHAQLGYLLKDTPPEDYPRAASEFSKAIEIRDRIGQDGFCLYELNRAICNIARDLDFRDDRKSSHLVRKSILADLSKACHHRHLRETILEERDRRIAKWLKLNDVKPGDVAR
jgi:hypothetical protein